MTTTPERQSIDTSRPVEFENASLRRDAEFVQDLGPQFAYPLRYRWRDQVNGGWVIADYSRGGLPPGNSAWAPIRNVPEEPKRIKGWVSCALYPASEVPAAIAHVSREEAVARAETWRRDGLAVSILEIDLADGEGL